MIELITGLPGNGKTLYAIATVKAKAVVENRPVFYSGIKDLKLDWTEIEPTKWMECPPGALILIDECQKIFRNRSLGTAPPLHVTELEEHRHRGIDIFLLSQHPALVDPAIRRLAGVHKHVVRIFGMEASTVHKWASVKDNCDKNAARVDSEKTRWAFDKGLYGIYHSAEMHTMKRSIPMRLKLLLLVPVLLGVAGWAVHSLMMKPRLPMVENPAHVAGGGPLGNVALTKDGARKPFDPVEDAKLYVQMQTPRVVGLPHTAPKYDEITKPVRAPVPSACVQVKDRCRCWSQQGTPMDVQHDMCVEFVAHGFFRDFDPEKITRDGAQTAQVSRPVARY